MVQRAHFRFMFILRLLLLRLTKGIPFDQMRRKANNELGSGTDA